MDRQILELALIREGLSPRTIKTHLARLKYFHRELGEITAKNVDAWIIQKRQIMTHNSINSYLKTIRKIGIVYGVDELKRVKFLPPNPTTKQVLGIEDINRICGITTPQNTRKHHKRTHQKMNVFFWALAYTGARPHEIAQLKRSDIDTGRHQLTIHATKTHDIRLIPIPPPLQDIIYPYLNSLYTEAVFPNVQEHTWRKHFNARCDRLGIKREHITVYSLRHSFATRMIEVEGNKITDVQALLGHKKLETTSIYYHMSTKRLKKVIARDPLTTQDDPQCMLAYATTVIQELADTCKEILSVEVVTTKTW